MDDIPERLLSLDHNLHLRRLRLLGRGSVGTVFLAAAQAPHPPSVPPLVAVKAFSKTQGPHLLQRCRNEEAVLRRIRQYSTSCSCPFLPTLYCAFEDAHFRYLVLDYFAGGDLHSLRHSTPDKRFSCDAIRFYAAEIVLALEHLHRCGIVHRDVKPENIMLTSDGHIVLTDFDVSAVVDVDGDENTETMRPFSVLDVVNLETSTPCSALGSRAEHVSEFMTRNRSCSKSVGYGGAAKFLDNTDEEDGGSGGTSRDPSVQTTSSFRSRSKRDGILRMRKWWWHRKRQRNPAASRPDRVTPAAESEKTKKREIVGTDEYLAPEAVVGEEGVGEAADWWAVGVLLYEMVYGGTPFKGRSSQETLARVAEEGEGVQLQGLWEQPELRKLMAELLVKDPARRLCSPRGHPFFRRVEWGHLPHRIHRPPFLPCTDAAANPASSLDVCGDKNDDGYNHGVTYH